MFSRAAALARTMRDETDEEVRREERQAAELRHGPCRLRDKQKQVSERSIRERHILLSIFDYCKCLVKPKNLQLSNSCNY